MKTQAQIKREKATREALTRVLNKKLIDFRNTYLQDYADFKEFELSRDLKWYESLINDEKVLKEYNDGLLDRMTSRQKSWFVPFTAQTFIPKANRIKDILKRKSINYMGWYNEAQKSFDTKLSKVVERAIEYGMGAHPLKVEEIGQEVSNQFNYIISNGSITLHARLIYACGEIKAPHYRFIVTKRNN